MRADPIPVPAVAESNRDEVQLAASRPELPPSLSAYVALAVASAPRLTIEQRGRLARILAPFVRAQ